jgi:hypothetical protein
MDIIKRRFLNPNTGVMEYYSMEVYTVAEAHELGIEPKTRLIDLEEGDWMQSEDGYVCQAIRVKTMKEKARNIYRKKIDLAWGRYWSTSAGKVTYEDRRNLKKRFQQPNPFGPGAGMTSRRLRSKGGSDMVKMYARYYYDKGWVTEDQIAAIGQACFPKEKIPAATVKTVLRHPQCKEMIKDELRQLMENEGVTPAFVINKHKEIIQSSMEHGRFEVAEKANTRLMDMLDMNPDKATQPMIGGVTFTHVLKEVEEAKVLTP